MSAHVAGEPTISLVPVALDDARFARLMQLYLHEWSAILPDKVQIGPDALFVYPNARDGVRAVLICDERAWPAGFALVARDEHDVAHVKELFVLVGLRRRGFGTAAARARPLRTGKLDTHGSPGERRRPRVLAPRHGRRDRDHRGSE